MKLGDLIKQKINSSNSAQQKTHLFNVNETLIKWSDTVKLFDKFSHRLPEKISPEFKDIKLLKLWNQILDMHTNMLTDIVNSLKEDIDETTYTKLRKLTKLFADFIAANFKFNIVEKIEQSLVSDLETENYEEIDLSHITKTDKKTVFIIGLHPSLRKYVYELLYELYTELNNDEIDVETIIHKYVKLLQLTLISYTRVYAEYDELLWEEYDIPEYIHEANIVLRFTELKKKVSIGSNVIRAVYRDQKYTNENIKELPFYVLAQTSMYPGAKITNYKEIFTKLVIDYIEKIRLRNLTEFFRSETQTYTLSVILSQVFQNKSKDIYRKIDKYLNELKDVIYKYRFSGYKRTKPHAVIDREFYLDLYKLYAKIV
jgi:hypothetical protein